MAWVLTAVGVFGVLTALIAMSFAVLVFATGGHRLQPRALAGVLFAEGTAGFWASGFLYLTDDAATVVASQLVGDMALVAIPVAHLLFLSTLDTPLTRWLRPMPVRILLLAAMVLLPLAVVASPGFFVEGVAPAALSPLDAVGGLGFVLALVAGALTSLFGLAATIHSYRRAKLQSTREKARYFLAAFLARDVAFFTLVLLTQTGTWPAGGTVAIGILILGYVPLLAYGILRAQLFDIDLRIKGTIRRGAVLGAFVLVFFVVEQLAQEFFSSTFGYAAGALAALLLLLVLRPLERAASRVADAAMPRVQETPDYLAQRKLMVYRAAVESAMQDGIITQRERAVLDSLRASLGIQAILAEEVERAAAFPAPA